MWLLSKKHTNTELCVLLWWVCVWLPQCSCDAYMSRQYFFHWGLWFTALGLLLLQVWFICGPAQMRALTQDEWGGHEQPLLCSIGPLSVQSHYDKWCSLLPWRRGSQIFTREVYLNIFNADCISSLVFSFFLNQTPLNLHISQQWDAVVEFIV